MAKATFDWQFHINNYVDNFADSMSLVEYALANNLNRNSARRSMGAAVAAALEAKGSAAKATVKEAQAAAKAGIKMGPVVRRKVRQVAADRREKKEAKGGSDHVIRSSGDKPSDQLITSNERATPDQASKRSAGATKPATARGAAGKRDRSGRSRGEGADESAMVGEYLGNSEEQTPTRQKNRRGGARSNLLGRYAVLTGIDQEIMDMVADPEYISSELTLTRARLADMYQTRGEALQKIRKDYNKGGPWIDDNGAPMPKEQALMQVVFGTSQPITELEKSIHRQATTLIKLSLDRQKLALDRQKLEMDERNRHPLSLSERIAFTKTIFEQRERDGLTAIETARLFDLEGLPYPASLHAEMLREVTWIEPTGDAQGGVTDAELELMAREYEIHKDQEMQEWRPAREAAVAKFVASEAARAAGELVEEDKFDQDDLGEGGFGANGYRGEGADPVTDKPEQPLVDFDDDWEEEYQQEEVEELDGYEGAS